MTAYDPLGLDPIEGLDEGIAPWVEILRNFGVETYESCQGGADPLRPERGHAFPEPTIRFLGGQDAGFHALAVALAFGLPVSDIRRFWSIYDGEAHGPNWEIVFNRMAGSEPERRGRTLGECLGGKYELREHLRRRTRRPPDPLEGANCGLCGDTADNFHVSDELWEAVGLGNVQACFKCFRIAADQKGIHPDPAWEIRLSPEVLAVIVAPH